MLNKPAAQHAGSILERLAKTGAGTGSLAQATVTGKDVAEVVSDAVRTGAAKPQKHYPTTDVVIQPQAAETQPQEITKPKKTNDKQVLFHCPHRPNVGSAMPTDGRMIRFKDGWLLTEDPEEIEFIRDNLDHWNAIEVKEGK